MKTITIEYADGTFEVEASGTDYQAILKLAADGAYERGIDPEDVRAPEFNDNWME